MATENNRKDLMLTRAAIERATQKERLLYGALVAELRAERRLTQQSLADRSGVTSRTIRNIEKGDVSPQADKLIRLYTALDIDLDGTLWDADVYRYTAMIAPLIRDIHPSYRLDAVAEVIPALSRSVGKHPNAAVENVTLFTPRPQSDDLREVAHEGDIPDHDLTDEGTTEHDHAARSRPD